MLPKVEFYCKRTEVAMIVYTNLKSIENDLR